MDNLLHGRANIFEEIKKSRGKASTFINRVDEEVGAHNITEHFADIYEELYNKVNLGSKFDKVCNDVFDSVDAHSESWKKFLKMQSI